MMMKMVFIKVHSIYKLILLYVITDYTVCEHNNYYQLFASFCSCALSICLSVYLRHLRRSLRSDAPKINSHQITCHYSCVIHMHLISTSTVKYTDDTTCRWAWTLAHLSDARFGEQRIALKTWYLSSVRDDRDDMAGVISQYRYSLHTQDANYERLMK